MTITKDELQHIVNTMHGKADVADILDRIFLSAKIRQALKELENGEGMDWEDFKKEYKKDFWNELPAHVKAGIEKSRKQAEEGLLTPHDEVKKKYIK